MKQQVTEGAITVTDIHVSIDSTTCLIPFAFDKAKLLVCVPKTAHDNTSSPSAPHSSRASCSGTSQDQSHSHSERTPGARHKQQMRFVISFLDCVLFFFERSMRKSLLNPQGLFSSLLPLHRTMVFHTLPMQFQSTYWCTKGNLNKHTSAYSDALHFV